MFWIGLIIGIIVGWFAYNGVSFYLGARAANMSVDEFWQVCGLVFEAGHNRKSTLTALHDQEILGTVVLEEN